MQKHGTQMNTDEHRKGKSIVNDRGDGYGVANTQALSPFSVFICVYLCLPAFLSRNSPTP
jgi:hypothetical protein